MFPSHDNPRDYVVVNGVRCKPPAYYDTLFEKENPGVFSELVARRELDTELLKRYDPAEFWPSRMAAKEGVQLARANQLKRSSV